MSTFNVVGGSAAGEELTIQTNWGAVQTNPDLILSCPNVSYHGMLIMNFRLDATTTTPSYLYYNLGILKSGSSTLQFIIYEGSYGIDYGSVHPITNEAPVFLEQDDKLYCWGEAQGSGGSLQQFYMQYWYFST